jgi:hypothetical protein
MLKKRTNPSPSLSGNSLKSYIIHAATLILFEKTPHLLHSAFAQHPQPPTRPYLSTPLGQEEFQILYSILRSLIGMLGFEMFVS